MNELSQRQFLIFKILKDNIKSMSSNSLCSMLNISPRTLRYEIKKINDAAGDKIIVSNHNGYQLNPSTNAFQQLKDMKVTDNYDSIKAVTLYLLENEETSIYDVADACYVSESTVSNIIKKLNGRFEVFHLQLAKKGDNIKVVGSEIDKRRMLVHFFFTELDALAIQVNNYVEFFDHFEIIDINDMVNESLNVVDVNIDTVYFKNIVITLAISMQRILNHHVIHEDFPREAIDTESNEYRFLDYFITLAEKAFNMQVDIAEFEYMYSIILGTFRNNSIANSIDDITGNEEFKERIRHCIDNAFAHYGIDVDYEEYFERFVLHIHYLLLRSKNEAVFQNDEALSLKYSHPYIYDVAVYLTYLLEAEFSCEIHIDEIDLIAIYLGAIIANLPLYEKIKIVAICPKYNDLRRVFVNQLNQTFVNQIEIVLLVESYREIPAECNYDLIVTTVRNEYILANSIYVSPIPTSREIRSISNKIKEIVNQKKTMEMKNQIAQYFDSELFYYNHGLTNADDILKFLTQKMIDLNYVSYTFLASVYKREQFASTAFFNRYAIPHALDVNALQTKIAYYYSKEPIDWFGEKVNLVLLLASKEYDEKFSHIYNTLADILMDNELFDEMVTSETFEAFIDYITTGCIKS